MEFNSDEGLVLRAICAYFHETGEWPTYDYLDRALDEHEHLDVEIVGRSLEPFMYDAPYAPMSSWDPERRPFLGITALHECLSVGIYQQIAEDIEGFMQVFTLCKKKYRERDPNNLQSMQVTSVEVRSRFHMPDLMLRKVLELFLRTGLTAGSTFNPSSEGAPTAWSITISSEMRKYRHVGTIDAFIDKRREVLAEYHQRLLPAIVGSDSAARDRDYILGYASPQSELPLATVSNQSPAFFTAQLRPIPLLPMGPFTRHESLCFVLMPFANELRVVYETGIVPAATKSELQCQRADEIMRPGGIMAQVWESLMTARVVIADLTYTNANVFYELGLAHVIGHDVILLTQDMSFVPFDLRHMRCIKYSNSEQGLHLLEQKLALSIRDVLHSADRTN